MGQILNLPANHAEAVGSSQAESCKRRKLATPISSDLKPRLIPQLPDELSLQILARMPRVSYLKVKAVSRTWKAAIVSPELYELRKELGVTEEWLYILANTGGGKLLWSAIDPVNGSWLRLPLMPSLASEEARRAHFGGWLWHLVSSGTIKDVIRSWVGQKGPLDHLPFSGCAITSVNGCLYVLGGFSRESALKSVWRYDPRMNCWDEVSSMATGRAFCKTSPLKGKLYAVGGVDKSGNSLVPLQCGEVFDPQTGTWAPLPSMPCTKANALPAAFLAELLKPIATGIIPYKGKLCVPQSLFLWPFFVDIGGEVFDSSTNTWTEMPAGMGEGWPARQASMKLCTVIDDKLYTIDPSGPQEASVVKIYDHKDDAWKVVIDRIPVYNFADSDSPCLLVGLEGKLHLVMIDTSGHVSVLRADMPRRTDPVASSSNPSDQQHEGGLVHGVEVWNTITSKRVAVTELISCQVLNL